MLIKNLNELWRTDSKAAIYMSKSKSNKIVASDVCLPFSHRLLSWASILHNITFLRAVMSIHFLKIILTSCVHDLDQLILS